MRSRASAVIANNGKVLLMHRRKEGVEYWLFPGGGIEEGESKEEAVRREVAEETSLNVTKCMYSFDYIDENGKHPVFICEVEDGTPKIADGSPEAEAHSETDWYHPEWIDLEEALKLDNLYPEEGKRVISNLIDNKP